MNLDPTVSRRSALVASACVSAILAGCKPGTQKQKRLLIIKTRRSSTLLQDFYPMYDFAKRIAGDHAGNMPRSGTEP